MEKEIIMKYWAVTGTFHGSLISADCEGTARKAFHSFYNGESIIDIKNISKSQFYKS